MPFVLTVTAVGLDTVCVSDMDNVADLAEALGGTYDADMLAISLPSHLFVPLTPDVDRRIYDLVQKGKAMDWWGRNAKLWIYQKEAFYALATESTLTQRGCGYTYVTEVPAPGFLRHRIPQVV